MQEEQSRYPNKRGSSKHKPVLPLYTEDDAHASLKRFSPVPYDELVLKRATIQGLR